MCSGIARPLMSYHSRAEVRSRRWRAAETPAGPAGLDSALVVPACYFPMKLAEHESDSTDACMQPPSCGRETKKKEGKNGRFRWNEVESSSIVQYAFARCLLISHNISRTAPRAHSKPHRTPIIDLCPHR